MGNKTLLHSFHIHSYLFIFHYILQIWNQSIIIFVVCKDFVITHIDKKNIRQKQHTFNIKILYNVSHNSYRFEGRAALQITLVHKAF
jgi:hypothetical protein